MAETLKVGNGWCWGGNRSGGAGVRGSWLAPAATGEGRAAWRKIEAWRFGLSDDRFRLWYERTLT